MERVADRCNGPRRPRRYARCVNVYRVVCDRNRREHGSLQRREAMLAWEQWLKEDDGSGN